MSRRFLWMTGLLTLLGGCNIEEVIFPKFGPAPLAEPPATLGSFTWVERRVELADLGDGGPGGVTVFEPVGAEGARPALVWVLGVNNAAYYHQSFHEYMASWGYVDIIPDTRPISFADTDYNGRNTRIANKVFDLALAGELGVTVDTQRIAFGGYSVGGSEAALAAGSEPRAKALAMWAPSPSYVWQGIDPNVVLPQVTAPSLFLLAELDNVVGDWPQQMQNLMTQSDKRVVVIPQGVHLFFQQPSLVDDRNPFTTMTRQEQMRIAFETTRSYLDETFGIAR